MGIKVLEPISSRMVKWLMKDKRPKGLPYSDYEHLKYDIKPCDVILIEGRSRVAEVTKLMTQSRWSHAGLYLGHLYDIPCPESRKIVSQYYQGDPEEPLIIEGFLGKGIIISPLSMYQGDHIRVCRPTGLSRQDSQKVIRYAVGQLGTPYDVRQILDLARFLFPWGLLPKKWRSTLFRTNIGDNTRQICSSLIAEAFMSVRYPILPLISRDKDKGLQLLHRNPRLYTPSDFDYSPYFQVLKYPIFDLSESAIYRYLPWGADFPSEPRKMNNIVLDPSYVPEETLSSAYNVDKAIPAEQMILPVENVAEQEIEPAAATEHVFMSGAESAVVKKNAHVTEAESMITTESVSQTKSKN